MKITLPKGILIVFESIDGAGKSTALDNVYKTFDTIGFDCIKTKEPTDGVYGRKIRQSSITGRLSPEKELNLFIKDRKEHIKKVIKPALADGKIIFQDRYYLSSAAYQGARGLDVEHIMEVNEAFAPKPDMCVLLELPPEDAFERIKSRGGDIDLFEKLDQLKLIADNFKKINREYITRFDAKLSREKLAIKITKEIFLGPLLAQIHLIESTEQRKRAFDYGTMIFVDSHFK